MKRELVALTLILMVSFSSFYGLSIPAVEADANATIYIRADGAVEGTDGVERDGDVYLFLGDVEGSIVVERDNVVLDGAGYVLIVEGQGAGVDIRDRKNVTVKNLTVEGAVGRCGILLINAEGCKIVQNTLRDNLIGVEMTGSSSRNRIAGNLVENNSVGMEIYSVRPGYDNVISGNEVANNGFGVQIKDFLNTEVSGNKIISNVYGLGLGLGSGSVARDNVMEDNTYGFRAFNIERERMLESKVVNVDVDTSNKVNGKPIIYWVNQHDKIVPANAGYVALIGCSGITVKNLDLGGNLEAVFLGSTTNSTITNIKVSGCLFGVNLDASSNNTISKIWLTGNEHGVHLRWGSDNNVIEGNDVTLNAAAGIHLAESSENKIIENNIANNDKGVYTEYCGINVFVRNNFVNNSKQWDDIGFTPWPIPLPISVSVWDDGSEGNYWGDYVERYPFAEELDGLGVWDTPYVLGENNKDNYPLMAPVPVAEFPGDFPPKLPPTAPPTVSPGFLGLPVEYVYALVAVIVVVTVAVLLVYWRRRGGGGL
jgi:parallel beta-helix repeat protein